MGWRFSSMMDLSSWSATLIIVMYHVRFLLFVDYADVKNKTTFVKAFYFFTGLGQEAFIVVFAIAGLSFGRRFLNRWNCTGSDDAGSTRDLFVRSYITLLAALLVGGALDFIGVHFFNASGLYAIYPEFTKVSLDFVVLIGNMLMLQGIAVPTYGSNGLLFLMSYVWWYSGIVAVMFVLFRSKRRIGKVIAAATLIVLLLWLLQHISPDFALSDFTLYLAVWLLGVAAVGIGESRLPKPRPLLSLLIFVLTIILSRIAAAKAAGSGWSIYFSSAGYIIVGIAFSMLMISVRGVSQETANRGRCRPDLGWINHHLAAFSYQTYFCHFPFMLLIVGMGADLFKLELRRQPSGGMVVAFFAALLLIYCYAFLFSRVTEKCADSAHEYLQTHFLWRRRKLQKIED